MCSSDLGEPSLGRSGESQVQGESSPGTVPGEPSLGKSGKSQVWGSPGIVIIIIIVFCGKTIYMVPNLSVNIFKIFVLI